MTRTTTPDITSSSRSNLLHRLRSSPVILFCWFCAALPSFGQTFVAEWTASAQGGVTPTGMALATESGTTYLYVCDEPRGRILKINPSTGLVVGTLGQQGTASGQLSRPYGIAVHAASGDLYVVERGNHRVQRFTSAGASVLTWGSQGSAPGQFNEPVGVALDSAGDVYVVDHGNNRVQKFHVAQTGGTWAATSLTTWGSAGSGNGQFNSPYGIAIDDASNVWVADGFNGRVQKFNTSGQFQAVVGAKGPIAGQFIVATWVGIGPGGELFVTSTNSNPLDGALADANNQWISRFTSAGAFVSRWGGTFGSAPGQFRLPFQAVVGPGNRVYVSDYYNNRVQVFDLSTTGGGTGGGSDSTAPTVASFTTGATTATSVTFNLVFREPVTGVDASDFTVVTTGGATGTIGTLSGNGAGYAIPVTFTGTGTVGLTLKSSGTGIVDAASNALASGATSSVYTIPSGGGGGTGGTSGTQIVAVTTPANGTYDKGAELTFTLRFSSNVTLNTTRASDADQSDKKDDEDDDDAEAFFTWTAVGTIGGHNSAGKITYRSGSGTDTLTFRYKVKNGDTAPSGILLGTTLQLDKGTALRDASGATLDTARLTIPWPQNPLRNVILAAAKSNNGKDDNDNNGNGNGNGNGRSSERLVNLSSRLRVTGGDASRSVVAGFVVTGSAPKPILIRAVGPGLAGFGIRDGLAQPRLQLRDSAGRVVAENNGWNNQLEISLTGERVGAFKLTSGSRDAALLVALNPGAYTAQVTSNGNGLVLVEIYDASSGTQIPSEQIVNISTRGFVGTGDDVLVAGFVVTGNAPRRVLVRGVGPTLGTLGVPGVLTDPVLKLYAAGTTNPIAQNDNWETPQSVTGGQTPATAAEIATATTAAGAFPLGAGSKDAALEISLAPGNYSAVLSGAGNTTGAALLEIYEVR